MTKMTLSKLLKPFSIKSKDIRVNHTVLKGYTLNVFKDAFSRYLASNPPQNATTLQAGNSKASNVAFGELEGSANNQSATPKSTKDGACSDVAPWMPELRRDSQKGEVMNL